MSLKKDFHIVLQKSGKPRKRFLISINKLSEYLPENRVKQVMNAALNLTQNKQRVGLYNGDFVDIYRK